MADGQAFSTGPHRRSRSEIVHEATSATIRQRSAHLLIWTCVLLALSVTPVEAQPAPSTVGRWSSSPALPWFPTGAHMLPTGKVLVYPGDPDGNPPGIQASTQRLWDPANGTTTAIPNAGYDVFCSGHAFLADGRLFIAGGHVLNGIGESKATTYDPFANAWFPLSQMNAGRWYPTATTLANGDMLVVSGQDNALPQVFQVASGTWRNLTNAVLSQDLYPRMHLHNGTVFNSGPTDVTRRLNTSGTGAWSFVANRNSGYTPYGTAVQYDTGKILEVGGGDPPTNQAMVIDLNAGSPAWRSVASLAVARRQVNSTILPDGKVLVTGGTSGPGFNNTTTPVFAAEMWDPATETWSTMDSAHVARLYHSVALLLPDGRVFSSGGNAHPEVEIYEPPYLFNPDGTLRTRPTITSAPTSVSYGQTFFVQTANASAITNVNWIRLSSVTHAFNQNQRINRLSFTATTDGLNVTAPANNVAPPGHYMLFILNANGVPSIAKIVQ